MALRPIRVLLVEDSEEDAVLVLRELKKGGFVPDWERVQTPDGLADALDRASWDVILSDYAMPGFSGPAAYELMKKRGFDLPFIIVSGTIGEETAVAAMKAGVHDFVLKDRLHRLVPAVERELREAHLRADREKIKEQLLVSDRMATVGALTAGVAHEINNPLTSIIANLELAMKRVEDGEMISDEIREALEAAMRLRQIARDLRIFSRAQTEEVAPVDVNWVLQTSLRMARNEIRHRARLVETYGDVPLVEANESRLGQVFLNLIVNAAQSIEEGRADANEIRVRTRMDDKGRVVAEVADTGSGMSPEVLKQLFTPFFTTKPASLGTGLGLAICKRIITEAGGEITVESAEGKGTVFRVALTTSAKGAAPVEHVTPAAPSAKRRGRILVVDDEALIRSVVRRALSSEHDVVAVSSGPEALAELEKDPSFDVILSDVMMPEMTGLELLAELEVRSPAMAKRVIFLTGGAFASQTRDSLSRLENDCLEKPFDVADLRALVNQRVA